MRSFLTASALSLVMLAPAFAQTANAPVQLVPHRAVYDLSLARSGGSRGLDNARGRIAMEFGGNACDGYTLTYRQVTVLDGSETGSRTLDTRTATFETGDGQSMRFKSTSTGGGNDGVDGDAKLKPDGSLDVRFKQPRNASFAASGQPIFPTEHLKRLIEAARAGQTTLTVRVYDGSDDGKKVYETLGVIGHRIAPGAGDNLEEAIKQDGLAKVPRWPVTISYFTEGVGDRAPIYTISFELFENGISRALKLDYGDFALKGDLQSLQIQTATPCQR
ncbi:cell envelope integrity EipB family protein [Microvirga terricola]|uniref:Cell envelope integrity EipB family protein n=1 Tax=Microvirga terricola TaxID=2719797 RepID=A0ABX0VEX7_9HYPH|nr:cell envelope integrity EipB family protein [Microvirga terricola]NIX77721.1 cell envelope integrity EipB family protein [Microvirga terricola]